METKHKSRKDVTKNTEIWYKSFMLENYENQLIPTLPPELAKKTTPQKKSNSQVQTQVTPEKEAK